MRPFLIRLILTVLCAAFCSCGVVGLGSQTSPKANPSAWPDIGPGREIAPGIIIHQVELPRPEGPTKIWIYLPKEPSSPKVGCILIGPAGARLYHGMSLVDDDNPEHLPYVRAGFAVVSYDIDGPLERTANWSETVKAARAFKNAEAGVANARLALDYALAKIPSIDPARIYSAGHSSAATLSLLVAENDPRIRACIAYAPVCDVVKYIGDPFIRRLNSAIPGFESFITKSSPNSNPSRLKCPLFLFHADDDSIVPTEGIAEFAEQVKQTNPNVTFFTVPIGDHYESMIREGIPEGIRWLKSLEAAK